MAFIAKMHLLAYLSKLGQGAGTWVLDAAATALFEIVFDLGSIAMAAAWGDGEDGTRGLNAP